MFESDYEFENEVRRIARLMWPSAEYQGAAMVDNRERDGVFETGEYIYLIECTTSRSKSKAEDDCKKLDTLIKQKTAKHPDKFVKGWFITKNEPTADQRNVASKYQKRIIICSFDQFRSKLINGIEYLSCRAKYPFGSVRNPSSGESQYDLKYTPLDIYDINGNSYDIHEFTNRFQNQSRFVLLGDFGAGKSSTARELFITCCKKYIDGKIARFPVMLNLRDHHGQVDPDEALERHARKVGFNDPSSLVRAWRGGFVDLIIDGFDEIASAGWAAKTTTLRNLRYRSMELIRAFITQTPRGTGILITGRSNFFDNVRELKESLGITDESWLLLELKEFNQKQVEDFLKSMEWDMDCVPNWLPTRPLLLAYLVANNLLSKTIESDFASGPAIGWHELLNRISKREADMEYGPDAATIRQMIEHIAYIAKSMSPDGLGPISPDKLAEAFKEICGYTPDDKGYTFIQRLPGLGSSQSEDGSRVFIDKDFAEAAFSGVIFKFINDPYNSTLQSDSWQSTIRTLGADIAAYRCRLDNVIDKKLLAALMEAFRQDKGGSLSASLVLIAKQYKIDSFGNNKIYLREVIIEDLEIDDPSLDFHQVEFQDCIITALEVAPDLPLEYWPIFRNCYIAKMLGRVGSKDIPAEKLINCTIDEFEENAKTTQAILCIIRAKAATGSGT